jgi:hypothetical protein
LKNFVPYHLLNGQKAIVIDGYYQNGLVLSHWKGANTINEIKDDSSAAIVLNALEKNIEGLDTEIVSATHFDIDGFIGVWALFNPELALEYKATLKEVATIGDFRELDIQHPDTKHALKLVCWLNKIEAANFYKPFGYLRLGINEMEACADKFEYCLKHFTDVLVNTENYKNDWEEEYQKVLEDLEKIKNANITRLDELKIIFIETPEPLHYYALFSITQGCDVVISLYSNNRYEIEHKYTTWVDIASRTTFPRLHLKALADILNKEEKSSYKWSANHYTDTGALLSLNSLELDKETRFDSPYKRPILSSSIEAEQFKIIVNDFFKQSYKKISPKHNWTWAETRKINKELFNIIEKDESESY